MENGIFRGGLPVTGEAAHSVPERMSDMKARRVPESNYSRRLFPNDCLYLCRFGATTRESRRPPRAPRPPRTAVRAGLRGVPPRRRPASFAPSSTLRPRSGLAAPGTDGALAGNLPAARSRLSAFGPCDFSHLCSCQICPRQPHMTAGFSAGRDGLRIILPRLFTRNRKVGLI